jgi:hypothetical protein
VRRRIVLQPARAALLAALLGALAAPASATQAPTCARQVPLSTDGRLQLATPQVQRGGEALALLSGFTQWPEGLVGGGSGETFLSCTPWQPDGAAEVMPDHGAALLLVPVPRTVAPGRYDVSILFREGSRTASGDGRMARLTASLVVTTGPAATTASSPVCDLAARPAAQGALLGPSAVKPGGAVPLRLVSVPTGRITAMNEYDRLWWVACTAGTPSVLAHSSVAPLRFSVTAPTAAGGHAVTVVGILDGRLVRWTSPLTVTPPAPSVTGTPPPSPTPTPSSTPAPSTGPTTAADHGDDRTWALLLSGAVALVAVGAAALVLLRRRARSR